MLTHICLLACIKLLCGDLSFINLLRCAVIMHLLGGIHGEITCRQAQSLRGHDPEDHQGLDAMAQIPTSAEGHHPAASSY